MRLHVNIDQHDCIPFTGTWKRNKMGDLSTAGTTVSTVIFRQDNIFVANVGDSTAVLGECHCFLSLFGWQFCYSNLCVLSSIHGCV